MSEIWSIRKHKYLSRCLKSVKAWSFIRQ